MKRQTIQALLFVCASSLQASSVLLTDNFNTGSYGASTFNDSLATDQGGSLATISYTTSAPGGDWTTQHSNGGAMLIVNQGNNWASLNHDFSTDPTGSNPTLVIQFDAWVDGGVSYSWLGFGIGSAQGTDFYSQPYGTNFTQLVGAHNYKFVISDTVGTGTAFNGITNGAKVDLYVDSTYSSTAAVTLNPGGGYITFKQDQWDGWSIGHVDNLSVSIVPEPGAALLGGLGMLCFLRRRRSR